MTMSKYNITSAKDLWDLVRDLSGIDSVTMEQCRSVMHEQGWTRYESLTDEQVGIIADLAGDLALVKLAQIPAVEVTRYTQDGATYICAGDSNTGEDAARTAAKGALRDGEALADDMERVDGCCTWTMEVRS